MKGLIILDFNRTIYDPDNEKLFDGVLDLIDSLKKKFNFVLVAKGDDWRKNQITELGLQKYFDSIKVVTDKGTKVYQECVDEFKVKNVWSISDRARTDIKNSKAVGAKTIWFRNGKYASATPETKEEEPDFVVEEFFEIDNIINQDS